MAGREQPLLPRRLSISRGRLDCMDPALGTANLISVFVLTAVVASVYSAAQEAHLPVRVMARNALRRAAKLMGVLAVLALAVFFLMQV